MRFGRLLTISTVVTLIVPIIVLMSSQATASDCPQSWNLKLPTPAWTTIEVPLKRNNETYATYIGHAANFGVGPKMDRRIDTYMFDWQFNARIFDTLWKPHFGEAVLQKIRSLDSNIVYRFRTVTTPSFTETNPQGQTVGGNSWQIQVYFNNDGTPVVPSNDSFWQVGLVNGTKVHYELDLLARGCPELKLKSDQSIINFVVLPRPVSIDDWIITYENFYKSIGRPLNWTRIELFKKLLKKDIELMKSGTAVGLSAEFRRFQGAQDFGPIVQYVLGVDPGNCMIQNTFSSTQKAQVYSKPCQYMVVVRYINEDGSQSLRSLGTFSISGSSKNSQTKKSQVVCVKGKNTVKPVNKKADCPKGFNKTRG